VSTLITNPGSQTVGTAIFGCNAFNDLSDGYDACDPDGTIYVHNGTYNENLDIDKNVTFIGESESGTIIDGGDAGTVITVEPTSP
jgi:nitrous oxidase accessory protein NosD